MKCVFIPFVLFILALSSFGQLSGPLSGTLGPDTYHVTDTIWINTGDSLVLLPGTTFTFDGPYPFKIYGTLLAEGTEFDSIVFTTEQSGSNRWAGLRFSNSTSSGSRLAYCLVEKGYATGGSPNDGCGGGVLCASNSSPAFTNCTIRGNSASRRGGGVLCNQSSPSFSNCTLSANSADSGSGGVYCDRSSPSFINCSITNNTANSGDGGGVCCGSSSSTFTHCTIAGNTVAAYGGGVWCYESSLSFINCTLSGNSAAYGGGVGCGVSSPSFINCTLSDNSAAYGGGMYCYNSSPTFNSTIIAFSSGVGIYFSSDTGTQIDYCDICGNSDGAFGGSIPNGLGELVSTNANGDSCDTYHNIFLNPMFAAGDFHLMASSPCIDAGDPTLPLDPDGTVADIGAFYYHQLAAEPLAVLLPKAYALHPNWPNPFNSTTMIRYDVPITGKVSLTIFNLLGQRIATLLDQRQLAGTHTIQWNAADWPSGVYLCRMEAGGFVQTRKMMLVK